MLIIEETYPAWENIAGNDVGAITEKYFDCPMCGAPHRFYFMTTMTCFCTACSSRVIDVQRLNVDKAYLLKYHFNIIDDRGRKVQ